MAYVADEFVLENLFRKHPLDDGTSFYFRELIGGEPDGQGCILLGAGPIPEMHQHSIFHRELLEDCSIALWRECVDDKEGYIVLYEDGEHLHTYHYPPEFL